MKYDEWLRQFDIHPTPKGARFDLRFYVYPDGHGNIQHVEPEGHVQQENQPVNDLAEALDVLRALWNTAMER